MSNEINLNPGLLGGLAVPVGGPNDAEVPMHNDDVIATLNDLIETCYDGEYGFKACMERTKTPSLQAVFAERMRDCGRSAAELASEVVRLGGTPEDSGTVGGTMHRGWVAVRDMLTSDDGNDLAMLEECERGEDIALGSYRKALKKALPLDIRSLVERQMLGVQQNHDTIKAMRDDHKIQR
ncbi:PA2169 family four-helix-bundle protein [Rhodoferax sp. WC2427]|uniref:ferritin-like domain-containing protein n=1 Tax=Rhodoferax sp. WC2427 TaxID=3234144 RepID=UPI0034670D6D